MVWMEMKSCFIALVFENGAVVWELAGINFAALCRLALLPLKTFVCKLPDRTEISTRVETCIGEVCQQILKFEV
jgi:hypothetical protein